MLFRGRQAVTTKTFPMKTNQSMRNTKKMKTFIKRM